MNVLPDAAEKKLTFVFEFCGVYTHQIRSEISVLKTQAYHIKVFCVSSACMHAYTLLFFIMNHDAVKKLS